MSIETALHALRLEPRWMRNVVHWATLAPRPGRFAPFPAGLDPRLATVLRERGIAQLYTHQAEAVTAALERQHVAVVTAAASGKTLCYNLPALQRLLEHPRARALYLFPTKALAHDQLAELRDLTDRLFGRSDLRRDGLIVAAYDGDTPASQRSKIRDTARLVLTNPDMLHAGILPNHPRWAPFFTDLNMVVLDEMHVYRGVFGSHVANVLRRLRRICRFYGSAPQFLLASATVANPAEVAERLVEAPVTIIGPDRDGAPQGEKQILFYNPPLLDADLGIRRSSLSEAADLAAHFLAHEVQTIVFARARLSTELVLSDLLRRTRAVRGYRGGYLPSERRAIEQGLRAGMVRGVVATNALELGIDIGQLDAAVLVGFPGTIASTRQQIGRAGRRQGISAAVLVATPEPLDQYVVTHPEYLLERTAEHARLNPDNEVIVAGHLLCAAAELPLTTDEPLGKQPLNDLVEVGQLYAAGGRYYWAGEGMPAVRVGLRSSSADRVVIQTRDEKGQPQTIGELERTAVPLLLHEGAIYLHSGASYLVEQLDWPGGIATVRPVEVDFYTRPVSSARIERLAVRDESPQAGGWMLGWGDVRVVSQTTGYRILRRTTNEVLSFGTVDLPPQTLETQACWLAIGDDLVARLNAAGAWASSPSDYGPNWPAQRAAARRRDGFRCQGCGMAEAENRQHDVHHRIPLRAFVANPALRGDLPAELAWQAANRLDNLVTLCPACHRRAETSVRLRTGLSGTAAALAGVTPLFLMCDPHDLGVTTEQQDPVTGGPTITLYDQTPGGVGYAGQLFQSMPQILRAAADLVERCPCTNGCPACVGPAPDHEYALDARGLATALLRELLRDA